MADEVVGLRIEVDSNAGEAVASLRTQLKQSQAEVAAMSEKFGVTSKEAAEAAKKAAELKDKIGDAKALTDAFNPDAKFKALSASLSGVAGGFAAVQGAMGLFGTESKDLEKQLLKVQSALALSQGLQSLGEAKDSFIQLGAVIKSQVVSAFSTLRGAIIATGIGALAIGLGLVVANFEAFKKAVFTMLPGLETFTKYVGVLINKFTDFVGITSQAERNIEALKKKNSEYYDALDRNIKVLEAYGNREDEVYKQKQARITLELNALQQAKDAKIKLSEEELKREKELLNEREILRIQNSQRLAKEYEDRLTKQKEYNQTRNNLLKEFNQSSKELQENELSDYIDTTDQIMQVKLDENQQVLEAQILTNQTLSDSDAQRLNDELVNAETRKRIAKEEADFKIEQAQRAADLLDGISNLIGKQTAAGKAAAVASTIINTYAAAQLAFKNAQLNPISILGSAYPYIQAGLAIAAGIKNVQQIMAVPVPNGGGSGGVGSVPSAGGYSFSSGGSAPLTPQTNVVTTQLTNQNLNELKNNTVKAYVVESEMTDAQTRIRRIQQAAEFGG